MKLMKFLILALSVMAVAVAPALAAQNQEDLQDSYDVIVYISGRDIIAKDDAGQVIDSGVAGRDDSRIIQTAAKAVSRGSILLQTGTYTLSSPARVSVSNPETGCLSVTSTPSGAGIYLDGVYSGKRTPHTFTGISPGVHSVSVKLQGYTSPEPRTAVVIAGGRATVGLALEAEQPTNAQRPYAAHTVPGRINLIDFDYGGEGIAYHDSTAGNQGGYAYRTDGADVDIGERNGVDVPIISNTYAGEWLSYSRVQVAKSGTYDATFYTGTTESGKSFSVFVDDRKVATVSAPNTGSWYVFSPTTVQIPLTAGEHVVKIAMDTGWIDMAYVEFAPVAPTPVPTMTPTPTPTVTPTPTATPTPKTGSIDVTSTPAGARIYLDGIDTGKATPYTLTGVSSGVHNVHVTLPGYATPSGQTVRVAGGGMSTVDFALKQETASGAYEVIVYLDGRQIVVENKNGQVIYSATAGEFDALAFKHAIDAVPASGGTVFVKAGTYIFNRPYVFDYYDAPGGYGKRGMICIDRSNVHLKGEGQGQTILRLTAVDGDEYAIVVNGKDAWQEIAGRPDLVVPQTNVVISDMSIEGRGAIGSNSWSYGAIWLWGANNCEIYNVGVTGVSESCFSHMTRGNYIHDCTFEKIKDNGINMMISHNNVFENILVDNSAFGYPRSAFGNGIHVGLSQPCNSNTFSKITLINCFYSVIVKDSNENQFNDLSVQGSVNEAILLDYGSSYNRFNGVTIRDGGRGTCHGILLPANLGMGAGNSFVDVTVDGFSGDGARLEGGVNTRFEGCTFINNGQNKAGGGLNICQDGTQIIKCVFDDRQPARTQQFGVAIRGAARDTLIDGCTFGNTGTKIINDGRNAVIRDCIGL